MRCFLPVISVSICIVLSCQLVYGLDRAVTHKNNSRVALVIGSKAYSSTPLRNPVNDARSIKKVLENLDFAVDIATDAERQMLDAIKRFGKCLSRAEIGFFFYAGHGMGVNGYNVNLGREIIIQ